MSNLHLGILLTLLFSTCACHSKSGEQYPVYADLAGQKVFRSNKDSYRSHIDQLIPSGEDLYFAYFQQRKTTEAQESAIGLWSKNSVPRWIWHSEVATERVGRIAAPRGGKLPFTKEIQTEEVESKILFTELNTQGGTPLSEWEIQDPGDMEPLCDLKGNCNRKFTPSLDPIRFIQDASLQMKPIRLQRSPSGSVFALLATHESRKLLRFDPDGKISKIVLIPKIEDYQFPFFYSYSPGLISFTENGDILCLLQTTAAEARAFYGYHQIPSPASIPKEVHLLIRLSGEGKLISAILLPEAPFSRVLNSLAARQDTVVLGGYFRNEQRQDVGLVVLIKEGVVRDLPINPGPDFDLITSVLILNNGNILVGGTTGYFQVPSHSVTQPGNAFLWLLDSTGEPFRQRFFSTSRHDTVTALAQTRDHSLYVALSLAGPITHDADRGVFSEIWKIE